jgi:aspartyl-tRNA(Asn)/glutamyl-tRNA(Gln) amidotransferase subunit B
VAEFRAGNAKALNAQVALIMKGSQGKANPQQVNTLLLQKLA